MFPGQCTEFSWQGERQQKILGRDSFLQLPFQPLLAFVMLTVGTVTMPARMRDKGLVFTLRAFGQHQGTASVAAVLHGIQGIEMRGKNGIPVFFEKLRHEDIDD